MKVKRRLLTERRALVPTCAESSFVAGRAFACHADPIATTREAIAETTPFVCGATTVVYDGRLDNRSEIAARLDRPDLASAAEGAVLAAAYEAWGARCATHLVGELSWVVIDGARAVIVACRDAIGVRRMLVYEREGELWLGSEIGLLMHALPDVPDLDRDWLVENIAGRGLRGATTVYRGLRELPPGHLLECDENAVVTRRWWHPPSGIETFRNESDCIDRGRSLIFEGVRSALRSATPVWTDLSGGLDSSTVACVAAEIMSTGHVAAPSLSAFSLRFSKTRTTDESEFQEHVLRKYELRSVVVDGDAHPDYELLYEADPWEPTPALFKGALLRRIQESADADGVVVNLTGLGGDQVFCHHGFPPVYLREWLRTLQLRKYARALAGHAREGNRSVWELIAHHSLRRPRTPDGLPFRPTAIPWATDEITRAERRSAAKTWASGERLFDEPAREHLFRIIANVGPPIAAGVAHVPADMRMPLLYRPLVEFVLRLPWEYLQRPERDRYLQREAMDGILPEAVRMRRSKANAVYARYNGMRDHWKRLEPFTHGKRLAELGLIEPRRFRGACIEMRYRAPANDIWMLNTALKIEAWLHVLDRAKQQRAASEMSALRARLLAGDVGRMDHPSSTRATACGIDNG